MKTSFVVVIVLCALGCKQKATVESDHELISRTIKDRLRDPDSYVSEGFGKKIQLTQGDSAVLYQISQGLPTISDTKQKQMNKPSLARSYTHSYRAKNGFGGMNRTSNSVAILGDSLVYVY